MRDRGKYGGSEREKRKVYMTYDYNSKCGDQENETRGDRQLETRVCKSRARAGGMKWMRGVEGLVLVERTGPERSKVREISE